jgi:hypothetical protein
MQRRCSPRSQVLTGGSTLHTLARHSSHKAGTTSLHEGKALRVEQNVLVWFIGYKTLTVLLNQRQLVLLSDKVLCVLGAVATVRPYFTTKEQLDILVRRPSPFSTKDVYSFHVCAQQCLLKVKVPRLFSGAGGFPGPRDGCYLLYAQLNAL